MLCNVTVTLHNTDVIVVSYIQSLLITIHYNSVLHSHIFYSTYDIKHVFVRLSQKYDFNSAEITSRNFSSEESGDKKGRTKTHYEITLPIFERKTVQEAKLWWRRFIQYVKMARKIDLNIMTTDKEILEDYREELEMKIKRHFYLGSRRRSSNLNDENGESQLPEQNEYKPIYIKAYVWPKRGGECDVI